MDFSGQSTPASLGKKTIAKHAMKNKSSVSELFTFSFKDELSKVVKHYNTMVNGKYQVGSFSVGVLRAVNTKENLSANLINYCRALGIEIKTSSAYVPESHGAAKRLVQ